MYYVFVTLYAIFSAKKKKKSFLLFFNNSFDLLLIYTSNLHIFKWSSIAGNLLTKNSTSSCPNTLSKKVYNEKICDAFRDLKPFVEF